MLAYRYGGKNGYRLQLTESDHHVVLRTRSRSKLEPQMLSPATRRAVEPLERMFRVPEIGVELHRVNAKRGRRGLRDRARAALKSEMEVEFAGRALWDAQALEAVIYTENLFVKFADDLATSRCRRMLEHHGVEVKREIRYLQNGFFAAIPEGHGTVVFEVAEKLLAAPEVELCHPELLKERRRRSMFADQWHLDRTEIGHQAIEAHANVVNAWTMSEGMGTVIAVIDDGFDLGHEEFLSPGKIVSPRDVTRRNDDPRPGHEDDHGTACAGIACADGLHGASGVAPRARLMPIRLASLLGSQDEADALVWAAEHGADVISCSWGPRDGNPLDAQDPRHRAVHFLPDNTRKALEFVTQEGRGGKGCVVTWAAGNGNERVDLDHYASNEQVIAVAACSDENIRSLYSDFGDAIWCCFPSNDFFETDPITGTVHRPRVPGIWTTDRSGPVGYNPGITRLGDRDGNYANRFGGTSSACPGVAGVVALMLSANPDLRWEQVRQLLREAAEPIDTDHGEYDEEGHSPWYGYGRVDAARAVELALIRCAPREELRREEQRPGDVTVRVETGAPDVALRIDDQPLELASGVARMSLQPKETYILSWWIHGAPGTSYRISLDADDFEVQGALPVEMRIAKDETKSADTRKFELRPRS